MINTIVVDDHQIFSDGIKSILEQVDDIAYMGTVKSAQALIRALEQTQIDVILMDISLGDESGLDITKTVKSLYPDCQVLILSMHTEQEYIFKALEVGASGYILKESGMEDMIKAIRAVHNGDSYYSQEVSSIIVKGAHKKSKSLDHMSIQLTPRETEILTLIAKEFTNAEIAASLFISIRTVDSHRRNLLDKIGVKNTVGLVKHAIKVGLITDL
jgi:DNA-binding NarL/FixJ family response regulator